jgi:hyperosmotically inducible periplasmic protein
MKKTLLSAFASALVLGVMFGCAPQDDRTTPDPAVQDTTGQDTTMPRTQDGAGDPWATTQINSAIMADTEVGVWDVNVTTVDRTVTITGEVETDAQRQRIEQIARDTVGPEYNIVNDVRVSPDARRRSDMGTGNTGMTPGTSR